MVRKLTTNLTLHGDSSEFESDKHENYVKVLYEGVKENRIKLSERERHLIEGIKIQHTKRQEMRASMFKRISNLNSLIPVKEHIKMATIFEYKEKVVNFEPEVSSIDDESEESV